ncbi:MAG: heavy-metal-associated domain-containing protein [Anaerolineae bacterium]
MPTLTFHLPTMYGDHHVVEVRRLLLEMAGVTDVYASSGFQIIEVQFEDSQVTKETIESKLAEAGYSGELPMPAEVGMAANENGGKTFFRHTAAFEQTGKVVSFGQKVPYNGRPLWPCPGMGAVKTIEEESTHG